MRGDSAELVSNSHMEAIREEFNPIVLIIGVIAVFVMLFVCGIGGLISTRALRPGTEPVVITVPTQQPTAQSARATGQPTSTEPSERSTDEPAISPTETLAPAATATIRATPETQPTGTLAPTATIPPNGSVTAYRTGSPFLIDGNLEGWSDLPSYASSQLVYSAGNWDRTDDLQAFWRLAFDKSNLYIAVLVLDDIHVQTQTGNTIWQGDSIEMQIDTDRDGDYGPGLSDDDFQLAISPGDFFGLKPEAYRYRGNSFGQMADAPGHSIEVASSKTDDGYVLEVLIPWTDLDVNPADVDLIGVALNVNDNDTLASARQEVMKSHVSTRSFGDPNTWGLLILSKE